MAVHTSQAHQRGDRANSEHVRGTITLSGVHKERMLKVLASNAKPNQKLREAIASARAARSQM